MHTYYSSLVLYCSSRLVVLWFVCICIQVKLNSSQHSINYWHQLFCGFWGPFCLSPLPLLHLFVCGWVFIHFMPLFKSSTYYYSFYLFIYYY
jgi:hypothetical protein